jgi:hypothetical protein
MSPTNHLNRQNLAQDADSFVLKKTESHFVEKTSLGVKRGVREGIMDFWSSREKRGTTTESWIDKFRNTRSTRGEFTLHKKDIHMQSRNTIYRFKKLV